MTNPPDFSKLTPPHDVALQCVELLPAHAIVAAYRAGAQHGWQQGKQAGADEELEMCCSYLDSAACGKLFRIEGGDDLRWLRRPPVPKGPTREEALAIIERKRASSWHFSVDEMSTIIGALEGGEGEE